MLVASLLLALAVPDPSSRGVVELTADGEVLLLPRHHRQPFDAWLYTQSTESCAGIEKGMLDVEKWPKRFGNVESVKATRGGTAENPSVAYEMELTVALAPTITGKITRTAPRTLKFEDGETKAYSVYELFDGEKNTCAIRYRVVEEAGKSSGWVSVMKSLEATAGDAGNYAAAVSSARGFAKPEQRGKIARSRAADDAYAQLAGKGTVVVIDRRGKQPTYTLRRRVAAPFSDVAWAVRNKKGYSEKSPVVKKASDRGKTASYTIGSFGGRVSFTTDVNDVVDDAGAITVEEKVSGGDLLAGTGGWTWRIIPVDGGADVELTMKVDIVAGSRFLSTFSETDPIARESFALHIALSFMGDIVGGKTLAVPTTTIARETPAAPPPTTP